METVKHAARICSQYIGMEFGIEKYAMLVMKSVKRYMMEVMELQNQEKNSNARWKGKLQLLGDIESWHHQTSGDERKKKCKKVSQENQKNTWDEPM